MLCNIFINTFSKDFFMLTTSVFKKMNTHTTPSKEISVNDILRVVEVTSSNIPCMWERGSENFSNNDTISSGGYSLLICNKKGFAKVPVFVNRPSVVAGFIEPVERKQALIPVAVNDYFVEVYNDHFKFDIRINLITGIDLDLQLMSYRVLYRHDPLTKQWNTPVPEFLNEVVKNCKQKSMTTQCFEPWYVLTTSKKRID